MRGRQSMIDAQRWMVSVLFDDAAKLTIGLTIFIITIHVIFKVKGWLL
jgi:hypothetical protein